MKLNNYQITAITTVLATLLLIFVGGLVRASGAGLGCPDWPKCYGLWIPPTSVSEVPSAFNIAEFNAIKTWTEYINRLIGVLIGLLITATFVQSFRYRKEKLSVTVASGAAFVLVIFQGWLGGQVVLSGLSEWIITIHMMVAMVIVGLLVFAMFQAMSGQIGLKLNLKDKKKLFGWSVALLIFTMIQMGLGTQVREAIDVISRSGLFPDRTGWIAELGLIDDIHRSFSWLVLISSGYIVWYNRKHEISTYFAKLGLWVFALVVSQVVIGVVLAYGGMPAAFQVLHLFGSALLVSAILLLVFSAQSAVTQRA
jgi:cytochrome c oxidase assembly protein subunit 15